MSASRLAYAGRTETVISSGNETGSPDFASSQT
jgi:hypothetical protein